MTETLTVPRLDELARLVHAEHAYIARGVDAKFAIGHALLAAKELLPSTQAYGAWFRSQGFPFSIRTGHNYCSAADHEAQMRALMARSEILSGRPIGFTDALNVVRRPPEGIRSREPSRAGRRRVPDRTWAWLVAVADVSIGALNSDDPRVVLTERVKLLNALAADVAER